MSRITKVIRNECWNGQGVIEIEERLRGLRDVITEGHDENRWRKNY